MSLCWLISCFVHKRMEYLMINYAGLGRIPFPTMDIKILKHIDIIKGIKPDTKPKPSKVL